MNNLTDEYQQDDSAMDKANQAPNVYVVSCGSYLSSANACTNPRTREEQLYCFCVNLYNGLSIKENEDYGDCVK